MNKCLILSTASLLVFAPMMVQANEISQTVDHQTNQSAEVEYVMSEGAELKADEKSSDFLETDFEITYTFIDPETGKEITFDQDSMEHHDGTTSFKTEDGTEISVIEKYVTSNGNEGVYKVFSEENEISYSEDQK